MSASAHPASSKAPADAVAAAEGRAAVTPAAALIPDRGEFIDVLRALCRGHVLVHAGNQAGGWAVDGGVVYTAYEPLLRFELVQQYDNPAGFEHVQYFRLTGRGRDFARRACAAWRQRPLVERLAVRLLG